MQVKEAQRLKELEKENARLTTVADLGECSQASISGTRPGDRLLKGSRLKKLLSAPQKKKAVRYLVLSKKCSERQACRFVGLSRSTARYATHSKADEVELVERLREFARKRRRRGYRLAHQELRRSGLKINHKRVLRLWRKAGLSVPSRRKYKKIRTTKPPRDIIASQPNGVWCLDFVQDSTISGTKPRILSVTDEFAGMQTRYPSVAVS